MNISKVIYLLLQRFIFLDAEGTPIQELAAFEVDCNTQDIINVFHAFAYTENEDSFARRHIHGLNKDYLKTEGYPSEQHLIEAFSKWLSDKPNVKLFANGAYKETVTLGVSVEEFKLLPWAERMFCSSHKTAVYFKNNNKSIFTSCGEKFNCCNHAHSSFVSSVKFSSNHLTLLAKEIHGFHCALYDALELYFKFVTLQSKTLLGIEATTHNPNCPVSHALNTYLESLTLKTKK